MLPIFQWNTLPSSSGQQHESSALKMETAIPSKTLLMNYQHSWHHIPEDSNLHSQTKIMIKICYNILYLLSDKLTGDISLP
jgi:hypothetical protein